MWECFRWPATVDQHKYMLDGFWDNLKCAYVLDALRGVLCVAEHAGAGGREIQIRRFLWAESEDGKFSYVNLIIASNFGQLFSS
jgi:hypothetical protein